MNFGEQFKVVLQKFRGKTLTRPDLIRICCVEIFGMQQSIIDQKDKRILELESNDRLMKKQLREYMCGACIVDCSTCAMAEELI